MPVIRRAVVLLVVMAVGWVAAAPSALAHQQLQSTEPAADTVVTEVPPRIQLTFDGEVTDADPVVELRNADGDVVIEAEPVVDGPTVTVPVDPSALTNGSYTVDWQVLSSDGHEVSGSFRFTVDAPARVLPAPSPTESGPAAAPDTAGTDVDEAVGAEGGSSVGWWIALGAFVLAVAIGVLVALRRRGR